MLQKSIMSGRNLVCLFATLKFLNNQAKNNFCYWYFEQYFHHYLWVNYLTEWKLNVESHYLQIFGKHQGDTLQKLSLDLMLKGFFFLQNKWLPICNKIIRNYYKQSTEWFQTNSTNNNYLPTNIWHWFEKVV